MPSPTTALQIITVAMRLKGIIASGETPSADEANDGLAALNDVLETWSTESYAVTGSLPETFVTVAGQATYTIGPGGDWDTERPIGIMGGYTAYQGVDFTFSEWNLRQYDEVGLKTQQQQVPERFIFVNDSPLARVILYPTPMLALPVTLETQQIIVAVPDLATTLTMPPGYVRALQYAVAEELGPQYGSPIDLSNRAVATLAKIKRANRRSPIASFDATLLQGGGSAGGSFYG